MIFNKKIALLSVLATGVCMGIAGCASDGGVSRTGAGAAVGAVAGAVLGLSLIHI